MPAAEVSGSLPWGLALAALSAVFNGTHGMLVKLCQAPPDPVIFNTLLSFGALLSSLLALLAQPLWGDGTFRLYFTWWGTAAGALFVFATLFAFLAIPRLGIALTGATCCTSAMVVAFLWGAVGPTAPPRQPMKDVGLSILAVATLVFGALIINFSSRIGRSLRLRKVETEEDEADEDSATSCSGTKDSGGAAVGGKAMGLLSAVIVGLFGGSVLVPAAYVREEARGMHLLPSFGLGAAVVGTAMGAVYCAAFRPVLRLELRREVVRNGIGAGCIWNLGNMCQIVAQDKFGLSYGIAYPILQCALLFSGLWGIYYFKEETHPPSILVFWLGAAVLIAGVVLLGFTGPGA